jgi:hypothetical protein
MSGRDMAHRLDPDHDPAAPWPAPSLVDVAVLLFGMLAVLLVVAIAGGPPA